MAVIGAFIAIGFSCYGLGVMTSMLIYHWPDLKKREDRSNGGNRTSEKRSD